MGNHDNVTVLMSKPVYVPCGRLLCVRARVCVCVRKNYVYMTVCLRVFNKKVHIITFFFFTCARVRLRVCVRECVQHDNLSVYVVRGAKQISNPQLNPSSCSDYKSAGALRSNQQEQSAAGTDTLSIRGHHHTVTHART